jgi:holo-[acyl-carrier protein] synthase
VRFVVGVDLIRISDVADSIDRFGSRYTGRVFTADEIRYCEEDPTRAPERYAARFAAKEATIKALRPGPNDGLDWKTVEVRRAPEGWCDIQLHGEARELANRNGVEDLALSMSHEHGYATATVVGHQRR